MSQHKILVEEPSLNMEALEVKTHETEDNTLHDPKNPNEILLIFRNQISKDTNILIDKTKIKTVGDIINTLLEKLNISQGDKYIRLFFKGRPLQPEENISDISKYILYLILNFLIYRFY